MDTPPQVTRRGRALTLSVVIPVYNEAPYLSDVLEQVKATTRVQEIIVVDDGSTDETGAILARYADDPLVRIHRLARNSGKGVALRAGFPLATGDIILVQDADLEYDPADYPALLRPFEEDGAMVVYGSRFKGTCEGMRRPNRVANRILASLANLLYRAGISDEATGYKAFRREVLQSLPLECRRFEFCPEVTALVRNRGLPIVEVPIHYRARSVREGKKVSWVDGVHAVWTLLRCKFRRVDAPRNRREL